MDMRRRDGERNSLTSGAMKMLPQISRKKGDAVTVSIEITVEIINQSSTLEMVDNTLGQENERSTHAGRDGRECIYLCNSVDIIYEVLLELINRFSKSLVG